MKKVKWKGVYPAVTTKFNQEGQLDLNAFKQNIIAQAEAGVKGIIIGGSLGESSTITHDERLLMLKTALTTIGHEVDIVLNIAEGSTTKAIQLIKRAEELGAHGFMLLPPMMYKPTQQEVIDFITEIANSTQLPIILYNNPVDYKTEITLDMLDKLLTIDNIQAIKESTRDTSNVVRMKNRFGDRLKILCGVDTMAYEELTLGADGWVAGLVDAFPEETVAIYDLIQDKAYDEALSIYQWFLPILELDISPQLVQNIKLAESLTGLGTEYVRPPRKMLSGIERERVIKIVKDGIATRPKLPQLSY